MVKQKASASHVVRDKKGNVKLSLEPEDQRSYQHGIGELLYGMDNLMEATWSHNAKGWWNGLTKADKLNHLRHLKPAFDYRDNSIPPSLYYQDFNSSGQQMIADYFNALQEEDPETSGQMKPTAGPHAVHGKKYNVHEALLYGMDNLVEATIDKYDPVLVGLYNERKRLLDMFVVQHNRTQGFTNQGKFMDKIDVIQDKIKSLGGKIPNDWYTQNERQMHQNPSEAREVLQSASGSLSPQKRNKAIRALQNIPRGQALGQSDVFPAIDLAIESLLHGMDNLIEDYATEINRKVKGWWNGLQRQEKIYNLQLIKGAGSKKEWDKFLKPSGVGKGLRFEDFPRDLRSVIGYYAEDINYDRGDADSRDAYGTTKKERQGR